MGLFGKHSKTTTDTKTTMTPTNPAQVTNGLTGFADTISGLQARNPMSFSVGADPLQTQAADTAGGLGRYSPNVANNFDSWVSSALNNTSAMMNPNAPQMQAARANGYINDYMNPYTNDVVNSSLADYDFGSGQTRAGNRLALAGDDTFGGSGGAIQTAMSEDAINRGRGLLSSNLRSQGWDTALGAAQQDADRQQQAAAENAQLQDANRNRWLAAAGQQATIANNYLTGRNQLDANTRANIDTQAAQGDNMRQIQLQKTLAPLTVASTIGGLWGSAPFNLLHGEEDVTHSTSKTKTSDPMGTIGGLLAGAGSLATGLGGLGLKLPGMAGAAKAAGAAPSFALPFS